MYFVGGISGKGDERATKDVQGGRESNSPDSMRICRHEKYVFFQLLYNVKIVQNLAVNRRTQKRAGDFCHLF